MGVFRFPYLWLETVIGLVAHPIFHSLVSPLKKFKSAVILVACLPGGRWRLRHEGLVGHGWPVHADVLLR